MEKTKTKAQIKVKRRRQRKRQKSKEKNKQYKIHSMRIYLCISCLWIKGIFFRKGVLNPSDSESDVLCHGLYFLVHAWKIEARKQTIKDYIV